MRTLDTSHPSVAALIDMLRDVTRADSSRDVLAGFIARFSQLRPIDHFVTVMPDRAAPGEEGGAGYRMLYAIPKAEFSAANVILPKRIGLIEEHVGTHHRGGFIAQVMQDGRPKYVFDFDLQDDPALHTLADQGYRSCGVIPIFEGSRVYQWALGFSRQGPEEFTTKDLINATMGANFMNLAGRGFDANQTIRDLNEQLQMQFDGVARVQESLLPGRLCEVPGYRFASSYIPSDQAGGDYFGFERFDPQGLQRWWGFMIADASGHGAAAATMVALLCGFLGGYVEMAAQLDRPELLNADAISTFVNKQMCAVDIDSSFITAIFAVLDAPAGVLELSNNGHPPPRLWRARTRSIESIDCATTMPLGIVHPHGATRSSIHLDPGDTLLLYTDGLFELFDPQRREQFGIGRLDAAFARACLQQPGDPDAVIDAIYADLFAHRKAATRDDDQTMFIMHRCEGT